MSLSTRYYVYLDRSTPGRVFALAFLGMVLVAGGKWCAVRRVRYRKR